MLSHLTPKYPRTILSACLACLSYLNATRPISGGGDWGECEPSTYTYWWEICVSWLRPLTRELINCAGPTAEKVWVHSEKWIHLFLPEPSTNLTRVEDLTRCSCCVQSVTIMMLCRVAILGSQYNLRVDNLTIYVSNHY